MKCLRSGSHLTWSDVLYMRPAMPRCPCPCRSTMVDRGLEPRASLFASPPARSAVFVSFSQSHSESGTLRVLQMAYRATARQERTPQTALPPTVRGILSFKRVWICACRASSGLQAGSCCGVLIVASIHLRLDCGLTLQYKSWG